MKRLDVGAHALGSGIERRKVMEDPSFSEGVFFNDDRSGFKSNTFKTTSSIENDREGELDDGSSTGPQGGRLEASRQSATDSMDEGGIPI